MKRPTKRDADTESLEQAVAVHMLSRCVTIAFIASGNRWPRLDKRSVKLSSPPPASQSTFANRVQLKQTLYNLSQLSGMFTNGAQLTPKFISKRRQSFCMLKTNKHNVVSICQRTSTLINFKQLLLAELDVCPNVGLNVVV